MSGYKSIERVNFYCDNALKKKLVAEDFFSAAY